MVLALELLQFQAAAVSKPFSLPAIVPCKQAYDMYKDGSILFTFLAKIVLS